MQGTYIPETNYVPREYGVAAVLLSLFMVFISLVSVLNVLLLLLFLLLSSSSSYKESHPHWNGRDPNPLKRQVQLSAQSHQFMWFQEHISAPSIWPDVRRTDEDNAVIKTSCRHQANTAYRPKPHRSKWFPNHRCSNAPHLSFKPTGTLPTVTYHLPVPPNKLP